MRRLYSFLILLLTPYLLLRLYWKGIRLPAYRQRILERFALNQRASIAVDVWVHAVSLGEVIAVTPVVNALLEKQRSILITTMTPTGALRVKQQFGDRVIHQYIPYDLAWAVKRFFQKTKARIGLIVETELWPNLLHYARQSRIALFLINARLSERSYQGYRRAQSLFSPILRQFSAILVQNAEDAERFVALGADADNVVVFGNVKFDLQTQTKNAAELSKLKTSWGLDRVVVLVASSHENEEQLILACLPKLQAGIANMVLLIAPRHPERFQKVVKLSQQMGFNTGLRSDLASLNPENEVVVVDSLGELLGFYQLSDYAFVGGSLVPIGGHNVLEPIAMQVPVFSGTHVHNFKSICRDLQTAAAIELVNTAEELVDRMISLHQDEARKRRLVANATGVLEANKGAVARYVEKIESSL